MRTAILILVNAVLVAAFLTLLVSAVALAIDNDWSWVGCAILMVPVGMGLAGCQSMLVEQEKEEEFDDFE